MRLWIVVFLLTLSLDAKTIRIAVIDSGIHRTAWDNKARYGLCKKGHKDFTGTGIIDDDGHGTNVSSLIHSKAKNTKYCQVIIKFYTSKKPWNMDRYLRALLHAVTSKVNIINISAAGDGYNPTERWLIRLAFRKGIKVVVAAGNDDKDINLNPTYPASYDRRLIVVGNKNKRGVQDHSNWGKIVDVFVSAHDVSGDYNFATPMSGTSQATALVSGLLIKKLNK